jgi:hypothetical protein
VEKVGCVVGKCLVLAYGVHESGYREAIAPRASVSVIRRTRRRITMASSASASTWPIPFGRRIGSPGPQSAFANLPKKSASRGGLLGRMVAVVEATQSTDLRSPGAIWYSRARELLNKRNR